MMIRTANICGDNRVAPQDFIHVSSRWGIWPLFIIDLYYWRHGRQCCLMVCNLVASALLL